MGPFQQSGICCGVTNMSLRATAHLLQFIVYPITVFILFFALGRRYGLVFILLVLLLTGVLSFWVACLRCPKCKASLIWQRVFLVYLPRFCESCGYDLGRKERKA